MISGYPDQQIRQLRSGEFAVGELGAPDSDGAHRNTVMTKRPGLSRERLETGDSKEVARSPESPRHRLIGRAPNSETPL